MLTEDYLMRMINQAAAALLQLIGLKKAGRYQEALQSIDQTLELLTGFSADLLRRLDDVSLFEALGAQNHREVERLALLGDVFAEEAEIHTAQGHPAAARESRARALACHLEASFPGEQPVPADSPARVATLLAQSGLDELSDGLLWTLFCWQEGHGMLALAETTLRNLATRPSTASALQPELVAFYHRLLELSPAELAAAGLDPAHLRGEIARLG
jgi:tetratricopeptide (TPR) repeat protein